MHPQLYTRKRTLALELNCLKYYRKRRAVPVYDITKIHDHTPNLHILKRNRIQRFFARKEKHHNRTYWWLSNTTTHKQNKHDEKKTIALVVIENHYTQIIKNIPDPRLVYVGGLIYPLYKRKV